MRMNKLCQKLTKPFGGKKEKEKGMTIIEILIVISLLGMVMTLVITNLTDTQEEAQKDAARLAMAQLETNLQMFKIHNFRYPTTEQSLDALVSKPAGAKRWRGPYTQKDKLNDPWGNKFEFESDGKKFTITSPGPDGTVGTEDDIRYPDDDEES